MRSVLLRINLVKLFPITESVSTLSRFVQGVLVGSTTIYHAKGRGG